MRLVRQLRAELGIEHGTVKRVAGQLGYGLESVRSWVRQADIDDGEKPGITTGTVASIAVELVERVRALNKRCNELER